MAGGYISLSGKDIVNTNDLTIKAIVYHAQNAMAGVIDPGLISARYASLMGNRYCYQILLNIAEHEYMMYKMTGQLEEWKNSINFYVVTSMDLEIIQST